MLSALCFTLFKGWLPLTLDDRHDSPLLDSRGALETVGIDTCEKSARFVATDLLSGVPTAKQLGLQVHLVERVDGLIVVRLDLSCMALSAAESGSRAMERHRAAWKDWAGDAGQLPGRQPSWRGRARGIAGRKTMAEDDDNVEHTLRDILETLVGSHDCDVVTIKSISRSKPGLDLEMQSLKAVDGGATRKKSAGRLELRDRRKWTRSRKKRLRQ